jgi:hypothetical protein
MGRIVLPIIKIVGQAPDLERRGTGTDVVVPHQLRHVKEL